MKNLWTLMLPGAVLLLLVVSCSPEPSKKPTTPTTPQLSQYQSAVLCKNCHERTYQQYQVSMHSKLSANPVFQAQYFNEILPSVQNSPAMTEEARQCLACHNPLAYLTGKGLSLTSQDLRVYEQMGTCDFCHTINGITGDVPGNGNYRSHPGQDKYGPHRTETNWHHIYSRVQSSSEFCGTCHNDNNHQGLEIKSTYTEWRESDYFKKRVSCQDCHMNTIGFLSRGAPVFDKGLVAEGANLKTEQRKELHTHTFPGAYSTRQVSGTVTVKMRLDRRMSWPGEDVTLTVEVDNTRSGHKLPTGSTELRLLWLEVEVSGPDFLLPLQAQSHSHGGFDVIGQGAQDAEIIGQSIAAGSRVYRQVFVDDSGRQTISSTRAVRSVFDNRLEAGRVREESYTFVAPKSKGLYTITARLRYQPYPESFTRGLNLPPPATLDVSTTTLDLQVGSRD